MGWYRDNNYTLIAQQICEYGIAYCQYSYSLPKPMSLLFQLFMQVNYGDYFLSLGFAAEYFDSSRNKFNVEKINATIATIQNNWRKKYPKLEFKTQNLKFDSMVSFNHSFTTELESLNFDSK